MLWGFPDFFLQSEHFCIPSLPSRSIPVDLGEKRNFYDASFTALRAFHVSLSLPHFSSQLDADLQEHAAEINKSEDISKKRMRQIVASLQQHAL